VPGAFSIFETKDKAYGDKYLIAYIEGEDASVRSTTYI